MKLSRHFLHLFCFIFLLGGCGGGAEFSEEPRETEGGIETSTNDTENSESPETSEEDVTPDENQITEETRASFYAETIEPEIIQTHCVDCHQARGRASISRITLNEGEDQASANEAVISAFVNSVTEEGAALVLSKASGGNFHGGGPILFQGTADYENLQRYLDSFSNPVSAPPEEEVVPEPDEGTEEVEDPAQPEVPDDVETNPPESEGAETESLTYYQTYIEGPVVQAACVNCHVAGGLYGGTRLVFTRGEAESETNYSVFVNFVNFVDSVSNGGANILSKVVGNLNHGGSVIYTSDQSEYINLESFIALIDTNEGTEGTAFFQNVILNSDLENLRRASLLLAGRLPTEDEEEVAQRGEAGLRLTIRTLMEGEAFHDFLIRGANDQLLTDASLNGGMLDVADPNRPYYPRLATRQYNMRLGGNEEGFYEWYRGFTFGLARAPLELIAFMVENDRDYREILTTAYTMVNPQTNEVLNGGQSFTSSEANQFRLATPAGQIVLDESYDANYFEGVGLQIISQGPYISYPKAGLLNEPAFLNRYPSTQTNRNRARARWTFYHFLGVDIEKSAARTTDPEALADTDNPTMNNPNCTVCHEILDPVAGAFQNFGNEGWFRSEYGGLDALPDSYKYPESGESLYELNDTWYRDMRTPGLGSDQATSNANSLQWLAQEIVEDPRFAESAVKFWWPALMSEALVESPENVEDANYEAQLVAFEAQSSFVSELAAGLQAGFDGGAPFNVKDMLLEMVMSDWFRAKAFASAPTEAREQEFAGVGVGRLLTPLELEAKTENLIGIKWGEDTADWLADGEYSNFDDAYRIYYGGIDSVGITSRAKSMNSIMANVALTHALSVSCPAVIFDFDRAIDEKVIFSMVDRYTTPLSQDRQTFTVTGTRTATASTHEMGSILNPGDYRIRINFDMPYYDVVSGDSLLLTIHEINVRNDAGDLLVAFNGAEFETLEGLVHSLNDDQNRTGAAYYDPVEDAVTGWFIWSGYVDLPLTVTEPDRYEIEVIASRQNHPGTDANISILINTSAANRGATGETAIRIELQQLHQKFLGETLAVDSAEIDASYQLFLELWQARRDAGLNTVAFDTSAGESCEIPIDDWWLQDWSDSFADPNHVMGTWISMLIYFMTDYRYLHE